MFFCVKQKTAYEMRISDWSSDVCSADLSESLIESLDEQIVRLEQDGSSEDLIAEIFRVAHTLKGSSGMLGLEDMARLTHAMEDLFEIGSASCRERGCHYV